MIQGCCSRLSCLATDTCTVRLGTASHVRRFRGCDLRRRDSWTWLAVRSAMACLVSWLYFESREVDDEACADSPYGSSMASMASRGQKNDEIEVMAMRREKLRGSPSSDADLAHGAPTDCLPPTLPSLVNLYHRLALHLHSQGFQRLLVPLHRAVTRLCRRI